MTWRVLLLVHRLLGRFPFSCSRGAVLPRRENGLTQQGDLDDDHECHDDQSGANNKRQGVHGVMENPASPTRRAGETSGGAVF